MHFLLAMHSVRFMAKSGVGRDGYGSSGGCKKKMKKKIKIGGLSGRQKVGTKGSRMNFQNINNNKAGAGFEPAPSSFQVEKKNV
jgi:hypothetical protein